MADWTPERIAALRELVPKRALGQVEIPAHELRGLIDLAQRGLSAEQDAAKARVLRVALEDARSYVDAVCFNTPDPKKRRNYAGCVSRIDAALCPEPKAEGETNGN